MAATWDGQTEQRLGLVKSASRLHAEVFKPHEPIGRNGYTLVVFVGQHQEPVDVLLELRSQLNDDEFALVSRALGY